MNATATATADKLGYSDEVVKLVALLEEQGAVPGWEGSLPEIVIDYLCDDIDRFDLIHRFECTPARAGRIMTILNEATGRRK